jgi:hypothetical protein
MGTDVFMNERKIGTIIHTNPDRGFSFVRVGAAESLEIYFMHHSFVRSGKSTAVGNIVEFRPSRNVKGSKPLAMDADIREGGVQ